MLTNFRWNDGPLITTIRKRSRTWFAKCGAHFRNLARCLPTHACTSEVKERQATFNGYEFRSGMPIHRHQLTIDDFALLLSFGFDKSSQYICKTHIQSMRFPVQARSKNQFVIEGRDDAYFKTAHTDMQYKYKGPKIAPFASDHFFNSDS